MAFVRTNIAFQFDASAALELDRKLIDVGRAFDKRTVGQVLRKALKPTLSAVRSNAPAGPKRTFQSTTRVRGSRKGTPRPAYEERRGGFTRKDARVRIVEGSGEELVRGLVGISKSRDKVGYRTHLITRANLHNRNPNDFLEKAERQTQSQVPQTFVQEAETVVNKILS